MRKKVYAYELMTLRTCRDIDKPFIIVIPRIFISSFRSIPGLADGSWKERLRLLSVIKKQFQMSSVRLLARDHASTLLYFSIS